MKLANKLIRAAMDAVGVEFKKDNLYHKTQFPVEMTEEEKILYSYIKENKLSITYDRGLIATMMACRHVVEQEVEGDFVECGVWRGGNAILAAALFDLYKVKKKIYLFDTFEGMTKPTTLDKKASTGEDALGMYMTAQRSDHNEMCYASFEDVKENFTKSGLLNENIVFIKGDVVRTLSENSNLPSKISLLRLDTDWYESTKAELEILYPRLSKSGVLIVDDYGYWTGSRKATDEYFSNKNKRPFLQYIDFTGRMGVKVD